MSWVSVGPLADLEIGRVRVVKAGREQAAVVRVDETTVHAVDNRCPHEGYPLAEGVVSGCTLTCTWHNYKFDLRDGACLKGDEDVRVRPVRVTDGVVEVELTPAPPDVPAITASLRTALFEGRQGQAIRDVARLLAAGLSPARVAALVAGDHGERAEWGATHVLALSADVLQWADAHPGAGFAIPFAQVIDLAIRDTPRRPAHPPVEPRDPGDDPVAAGRALREAVEAEDGDAAEALLLGALARGWRRAELEPWLFAACADHFLSFGHRLIYQSKVFDLLDAADWAHAASILRGHLRGIVSGTREDLLPSWRSWNKRRAGLDVPALYAAAGTDAAWDDRDAVEAALVDGTPAEAFEAVVGALRAGAPLERVVDAISLAAAERMLRFDVPIDADPDNQDTWLSVTHTQTFAHALRLAVRRFADPAVVDLVLQGARFVHHHRTLDGAERERPQPVEADVEQVMAAIRHGRADDALAATPAALRDAPDALRAALMALSISDHFAVPIVAAHAMKNLLVAFEEREATGDVRPILAYVRLVASPVRQRWTRRTALEAVAFVTEGRTPKLLAP